MFAENFTTMSGKITKKNSGSNEVDANKLIRKKELENRALKKILDFLEKEKKDRQAKTDHANQSNLNQ
jgi:hypothetical protein